MPLWQIIRSSRRAVLDEFVLMLGMEASARNVTPERVPNEINGLLDQLTVSLHAAEAGKNATLLPAARDLAADHGEAGAHEGRDIDEVVADFLALHEAILEIGDAPPEQITAKEHRVLARGINRAIAAAVARYAQARDHELQRIHAEQFAFLAHELRAPLSNIRMGVDLLDEGLDRPALLPHVRRSVNRMRELIDNEISSARLAAGATLHAEPVDLVELLGTVVDELRMQAHDRGIELSVDVPDALPLDADPRMLRSIFTNLVVNAIKFTHEQGRVTVHARIDEETVVCEVADGCGGLPEGTEAKLFQAFRQSGEDRSGFGLGLVIVSQAIALHGGTIAVVDRPGAGCTMVVRLPRAHRAKP